MIEPVFEEGVVLKTEGFTLWSLSDVGLVLTIKDKKDGDTCAECGHENDELPHMIRFKVSPHKGVQIFASRLDLSYESEDTRNKRYDDLRIDKVKALVNMLIDDEPEESDEKKH